MAVNYVSKELDRVQPADIVADSGGDRDLVSKVKLWQEDSEGLTSAWLTEQEKWHRMRMRIKKKKSYPFPGCSNLRMPTAEIKIRKLKAALYNIIFGIRPVVSVTPEPGTDWQVAKKIEKALDHIIMDKMDIKTKAIIAIDQELEKGFYLMKPYWRTDIINRSSVIKAEDIDPELFVDINSVSLAIAKLVEVDLHDTVTEDNSKAIESAAAKILGGSEKVTLILKDVIYNCPDVSLCSPERVYVPTTSGYNPQDCEYIIHEFFIPYEQLKNNGEIKGWDKDKIAKIKDAGATDLADKSIDIDKDQREGIERLQDASPLVKIWECYCYDDINKDGVVEKAVITVAPDFSVVLRKIGLPFYSGKFPFVKLFYELNDDRWFSHRGIPALIEDIVKEIDMQHNQKIDYQSIANAPMFLARAGQVNRNTLQFQFGQIIPVNGMQPLDDIIKPMQNSNPNIEFSYEREQMVLETKIEELIGQVDFSLQSMINKRQPRTLGEVEMQNQNMQQVFSLDANMHVAQFTELWNWIWELIVQYGDDEYNFMYMGANSQGEPIKLTREEIQAKVKIAVRGNDQNTNPQVKIQKAQTIMMGLNNPIAMQTGVITPIHVAQAYKRFYTMLDIDNWEELVATPEEIQQQMQTPPPPPPPDIKLKGDDLTDTEKAQVLQKQGIQPDMEVRQSDKQKQNSADAIDQLSKAADAIGGGSKDGGAI